MQHKYFFPLLLCSLFVCSFRGHAQIITTIAGTGVPGYNGDNIAATTANLQHPTGVSFDTLGNLYISDQLNYRIRKISTSGIITTVAGTGDPGLPYTGDGGPATAAHLYDIFNVLAGRDGYIYMGHPGASRINKVDPAPGGLITTIAGTGVVGCAGDGGPATAAITNGSDDIKMDKAGNLIMNGGCTGGLREIEVHGMINNFAGAASGFGGDGGPATAASFSAAKGVAIDWAGNIYVADQLNYRVRKINTAGIVSTVVGTGVLGYSGDGGPATLAKISQNAGIAVDEIGNLFIPDRFNHCIRKVNTLGVISTLAGDGTQGYFGDGGPATAAILDRPQYIAVHPNGNIYFSDFGNNRIRMIDVHNHIPAFMKGRSRSIAVCENSSISLDTVLMVTDADMGQVMTWGPGEAPMHGTATVAYTTTNTGGTLTTSGLSYTPAAGYAGADTFNVRLNDGISVAVMTIYVTVKPATACATGAEFAAMPVAQAGDLLITPNPSGDGAFAVRCSSAQQEHLHITVTDITGRRVEELDGATNENLAVKLNAVAGIYFVTATTPRGVWSKKVEVGR